MLSNIITSSAIGRFFRRRLSFCALIAVIILPLLCSGMYLWITRKPQSAFEKLPIAIINEDTAIQSVTDGHWIRAGEELVQQVLTDDTQHWVSIDNYKEALDDLRLGKYALLLDIPENFSRSLGSQDADDASSTTVHITYNDVNNFSASIMAQEAMTKVMTTVRDKYSPSAAQRVVMQLSGVNTVLSQAYDSSNSFIAQTRRMEESSRKFSDDANSIASISLLIRDAYDSIANTINTMTLAGTGAVSVLDAVAVFGANLDPDFSELQPLAYQIAEKIHQFIDPVFILEISKLGSKVALGSIIDGIRMLHDPRADAYAHQLELFKKNLWKMHFSESSKKYIRTQFTQAVRTAFDLYDSHGLAQKSLKLIQKSGEDLHQRIMVIRSQLNHLQNDSQDIKVGLISSTSKSAVLADYAAQLHGLALKLNNNARTANPLLQSQNHGNKNPAPVHEQVLATTTVSPIVNEKKTVHTILYKAGNSGIGMTPFLLAMGLFFGSFLVWTLRRALEPRAIAAGVSGIRVALAGILPILPIAGIQAAVVIVASWLFLGFSPNYPIVTLLFILLCSLAFTAFIQALMALMGENWGKIVAIGILLLQILVVQTEGLFLRLVYPLLPMSYAIDGIWQLTYGSITDYRLWFPIVVLIVITAGSLWVSSLVAARKRMWKESELLGLTVFV